MNPVTRHYDDLLAAHYTWMTGSSLLDKAAEQKALLAQLGAGQGHKRLAVDLGCGPGFQSLALADFGFVRVLALDTCQTLLTELEAAKGERPIETRLDDLCSFSTLVANGAADVIVCMGDTLTHLRSREDMSTLFSDIYQALAPGGRAILTFRDLSQALHGVDRFIPVQSDADRIMLCALDFGPDTVTVNDLIFVRDGDGWALHKSSYQKLRLAPCDVVSELRRHGFVIDHDTPLGRLHAIAARKPDA
ncbi:MAG: class I SAM-dependent methyltransferase [Pseudomonadota bacterium]